MKSIYKSIIEHRNVNSVTFSHLKIKEHMLLLFGPDNTSIMDPITMGGIFTISEQILKISRHGYYLIKFMAHIVKTS